MHQSTMKADQNSSINFDSKDNVRHPYSMFQLGVDKRRARIGRGLADADWRTRTARVSTAYINSKRKDIQT
jgi:hypothetical protein